MIDESKRDEDGIRKNCAKLDECTRMITGPSNILHCPKICPGFELEEGGKE